jgi:hypothetical protein
MPGDPPFSDTSIYIEQEGANRFKIQSGQLEQIGAQLRGRRQFSIFNSIILPVIVSLATIVFTSLFQYVSWFNSVHLQNAADVAVNAHDAYEKAAAAIGRRQYAMLVFLPSLRDLVRAKAKTLEANAKAPIEPDGKSGAGQRAVGRKTASPATDGSPERAFASAPFEFPLEKSDLDIKQRRFVSYYEQLKLWNESFDDLLHGIDHALDRPVFSRVDRRNELVTLAKFSQINCANSVTDELVRLHLDSDSLKYRFAVINKCFRDTHNLLDQQLMQAISAVLPAFRDSAESQIKDNIWLLQSKENVFRCYALQRIDYYNAQKELSILSGAYAWRWYTDAYKAAAEQHFKHTARSCPE